MAIEGEPETSGQRAALSRALVDALAGDPAFAAVANGARPPDETEQALLFRYRYLIGDAIEAGRFTPETDSGAADTDAGEDVDGGDVDGGDGADAGDES